MEQSILITDAQINDYQTKGAVCLRNVLTTKEIEILQNGIEFNLKNLSPRAKIASITTDPGLFVEDFCTWQTNLFYKQVIFDSLLGRIAGLLMKSKTTRLYHDHMLVKEANTEQHTPWHQDQPYYNIEGKQNVSMWIPVDPITRYSTLEFVASSHKGPWLMPRSFMDNQAKWFPEGSLNELPDIESDRKKFPIIGWAVSPGDVVCFHMLTLHATKGTIGNQRRRVFSLRFLGDDITYKPRPWKTSPEFYNLEQELTEGETMDHPLFPILDIQN